MLKGKLVFVVFGVVIVASLVLGTKKVKSLSGQIKQEKEALGKSNQRLDYLDLEESLEARRVEGKVLCQIPRAEDPVASKVLIEKFMTSFLSRLELHAEVRVDNERKSGDFPDVVAVREVPIVIGIQDYRSYDQIMRMLDEFRSFPFVIEMFTIGGQDIPVPGLVRLKLKYYLVPEGA